MKKIYTADLCDNFYDKLKVVEPIGLKNYGGLNFFYGVIETVKCIDNNPLVRKILSENGEGKVLVVDGGGSKKCALTGDNIAKLALENNWRGIIINGCIRDSEIIGKLNIGVKALDTNPTKSSKVENGEINQPVIFGNVIFTPGDYLYSDEDGIVVSRTKLHE